MIQGSFALADRRSTQVPEREAGTEWRGISALLADLTAPVEDVMDPNQGPETLEFPTAQHSSAIATRLIESIDAITPIIKAPILERFVPLQEWEGHVIAIDEDTFVARLIDITRDDSPEEEADFLISDLRKDDLKLLRLGALFRWVIGYDTKKDGNVRRASQIVFRRLPQWTRKELAEADAEAQGLARSIKWE